MNEDPEVLILDKTRTDNFPYILDDRMVPCLRGVVLEDVFVVDVEVFGVFGEKIGRASG